ncbi:MAG: tRNA (adenosine(37)-N6)-threonylcarbamoyltransferase complex dimerization subunit type 1 TsaB [Burkholderiales bacterium]
MQVLAIETSSEYCSVALSMAAAMIIREERAGQRHSELVLPMVDSVLNESGLQLVDLAGIAFGAGPGSFTGVRIACGVAQGLAFGAGLPVAPVVTLAALAQAVGAPRVVTCLDARMGEIYHAAFERREGRWIEVSPPVLCSPETAPMVAGDGWLGCGSGFDLYGERLAARLGGRLSGVATGIYPHAREVVTLGGALLAAGAGVPAEQAVPLYVRDKVALRMDEQP